jgi:phenylalanyl-tRNA synthetase beta chain
MMKLSLSWLRDYVAVPFAGRELAERLTMAGLEVEGIDDRAVPAGVMVAEILSREPHPNADKLSVCRVSTGSGEPLQVVCGAPNCAAGTKVALAPVGTTLTDRTSGKSLTLGKAKLRGIESCGMLCSARELGLGDDHGGILHLPSEAVPGTPLADLYPADTVYTLEITSNRPDWLSHWGIAREVRAVSTTDLALRFPAVRLPAPQGSAPAGLVTVEDFDLCPRYTGRLIRGVRVGESPDWLKRRLQALGLRPINNVVDITNFVLHELGQPLHAFDLNLLAGQRVVVRRARAGERLQTLDGATHELRDSHLLIADAEKPVALAGVMGGEGSGVSGATVDILLESAWFQPSNIRATARSLGISSDSSYRFERGVDWAMVDRASDRAAALILELAGGELASELVDVRRDPPAVPPVTCRFDRIRALLGVEIDNAAMAAILERLGCAIAPVDDASCRVTAPSWRADLTREADLAEEIVRIHGLDKIPLVPAVAVLGGILRDDAYHPLEQARNQLVGLGLVECLSYGQQDEPTALKDARFVAADLLRTANPVSRDFAVMRPSLFGDILRSVGHNLARQNHDLALFEMGVVFAGHPAKFAEERRECAIALTGCRHPHGFSAERKAEIGYADLKGLLESWCELRRLSGVGFRALPADHPAAANFAPGAAGEALLDGESLALLGEAAPRCTDGLRLQHPLLVALVDLDRLLAHVPPPIRCRPISPFPSVTRDVAFVADESLAHAAVMDVIREAGLEHLEKAELFDLFRDPATLGEGRKSLAYTLTFRHPERTLTDDEVNRAHQRLRDKLAADLHVTLR